MKTLTAAMTLALAIAGCPTTFAQAQGAPQEGVRPSPIIFWRLDMWTANTGLTVPTERVVTNAEDWRVVWSKVYQNIDPPPAVPEIDFSKEVVVVVGIGGRSNGGYQLQINTVRDLGAAVEISSSTRVSGNQCAKATAENAPVQMVRMPKVSKPVTFTMRTWTYDCLQ